MNRSLSLGPHTPICLCHILLPKQQSTEALYSVGLLGPGPGWEEVQLALFSIVLTGDVYSSKHTLCAKGSDLFEGQTSS